MKEKLKILELFGGIGACSKALERLNIEHEVVDYVEIDKYAVKSYNAIHGTNFEPQDITQWDKDIDVDLIMHGSPCQDFSLAGKQAGGDKDSGTRSSLLYETVRIVEKLKPKYVIWENVKNVLSQKHRHNFDNYLNEMELLGYTNYYQVLNAKDYGIPQNRERVFTVSILGNEKYEFPQKQELKLKLKDILEDEVDEKYYLTNGMIKYLENGNYKSSKVSEKLKRTEDGICPTLDTMQGDNRQPFIKVREATKRGYKEAYDGDSVNPAYPESKTRRGRVGEQVAQTLQCNDSMGVITNKRLQSLIDKTTFKEGQVLNMDLYNQTTNENISQCLTEPNHNTHRLFDGLRVRKLTPCEAFRLMGFDNSDFEKAAKVCSNSQLYKQAGNSIVVNVLEEIFKELFKEDQQ